MAAQALVSSGATTPAALSPQLGSAGSPAAAGAGRRGAAADGWEELAASQARLGTEIGLADRVRALEAELAGARARHRELEAALDAQMLLGASAAGEGAGAGAAPRAGGAAGAEEADGATGGAAEALLRVQLEEARGEARDAEALRRKVAALEAASEAKTRRLEQVCAPAPRRPRPRGKAGRPALRALRRPADLRFTIHPREQVTAAFDETKAAYIRLVASASGRSRAEGSSSESRGLTGSGAGGDGAGRRHESQPPTGEATRPTRADGRQSRTYPLSIHDLGVRAGDSRGGAASGVAEERAVGRGGEKMVPGLAGLMDVQQQNDEVMRTLR